MEFATTADALDIMDRLRRAGYDDVSIRWDATKADILGALKDPRTKAAAFIGHEAYPGAFEPWYNPGNVRDDGDKFVSPKDFSGVLGKRRLDWAIFHVCFSDDPELKSAVVGSKGRWEAAKGLWNLI